MATIVGTAGNDSLAGTSGNDTLNGLGGNDTLVGSGGTDFYDGGTGSDTLDFRAAVTGIAVSFSAGTVTGGFNGTFVNIERVLGGAGSDSVIGASGAQNLSGRTGNDTLAGAGGVDTLWGGTGADHFVFREFGTANADRINDFASGSDKIALDASVMSALGASGNFAAGDARFKANSTGTATDASDRVVFNTTTKQVFYDADGSGSGAKVLIATLQSGATLVATDIVVEGGGGSGQTINGTEGDDEIFGGDGDDTINGLGGNDILRGGEGDDLLDGGEDRDQLWSDRGDDTLLGGAGDDFFLLRNESSIGPLGQDVLDGGGGWDALHFEGPGGVALNASTGTFTGPRPGDGGTLANIEEFSGTGFADLMTGDGNANLLSGLGGGDTLDGGGGNDTLSAGFFDAGNDLLIGGDGNDSLQAAGEGFDTLRGGAGDDILHGSWGSTVVQGDGGNDLIDGRSGNDTLTGGTGADAFLLTDNPHPVNADLITDFASGVDKIRLDAGNMTALGAGGNFASGDARFAANSAGTAQDTSDRVIYNTATGELFYDADGSGAGAAQPLATLQGAPDLRATDIAVDGGGGPGQTFTGTSGNDSIVGTSGDDTLNGLGGNDTLEGLDGHDRLDGGIGNDSVGGSLGADLLIGGDGNDMLDGLGEITFGEYETEIDTLNGGLGDDVYIVDNAGDVLSDAGGVDEVWAADMDWTLAAGFENLHLRNDVSESGQVGIGNELDNRLSVGYAGSRLEGRAGNDTLIGAGADGGGNDLFGGDGNDSLAGAEGMDDLDGGAGNDTLNGRDGGDVFQFSTAPGAANADVILTFSTGEDEIVLDGTVMPALGASGGFAAGDARFAANSSGTAQDTSDRVVYNTSNGQLWYDADGSGAGGALLIARLDGARALAATDIEVINGSAPGGQVINGTSGNETLSGGPGNDTMNGLGGNDTLVGSGGTDFYDGGTGFDTLDFRGAATSVAVSFSAGTVSGGFNGTFVNMERVLASSANDSITGGAGAQTLAGQGGADTLWGAGGIDTLWGGAGADTFIFREMGTANADRISDWTSGSDKVHLDDVAFTSIGPTGNFAAGDGRFWAAAGATAGHDANDRVIYNTSTGSLYYDADGSGSGAAQLIATFAGNPAVAATDIVVI